MMRKPIETDANLMLERAHKVIKTIIITSFYMFKN